ncbi:hypothetical protein [Streptomyces sp. TLI_171]|uniref:hypothetical protein n=1 Tax=Streptomyces sp. TLI_171 TaxID=1938859 RepID=UPI000C3B56F0|nr:hypothetical protein [Streptomyces sp. TLI_171]RKE16961.1 hypothetical protein BX266_0209 [Streptomyces sp. TLI_171]
MASGDERRPVDAVVAALVQDGPAGPAAEAVARARQELHRLPRWREALARAEAAPQDGAALAALTEAVTEMLDLNSALAHTLAATLPAAPAGAVAPTAPPPAPPSAPPLAPPSAPPLPPVPPGLPPVGTVPVDPEAARRNRVALGVGAVAVAAVLVALGVHFLGGGSGAPQLPNSVQGDRMRASTTDGSYPNWKRISADLTASGMVDPQAALYGSLPNATSGAALADDDHRPRWTVMVAKSSATFQRELQSHILDPSGDHPPRPVPTSLPGTMYCDTYDPDDSATEREDEAVTCVWTDDKYVIMVEGTGVDERLPASVVERVHAGTEH